MSQTEHQKFADDASQPDLQQAPSAVAAEKPTRRRMMALLLGATGPSLAVLAMTGDAEAQGRGRCPRGYKQDPNDGFCYKAANTTCPTNYVYNERDHKCVERRGVCSSGEYLSPSRNRCQRKPRCGEGSYFDWRQERCAPDICFLTTACAEHLGMADDCFELQTLRSLRDGSMRPSGTGRKLIEVYEHFGPLVLAGIPEEKREAVLNATYASYILPSAILTRLGLKKLAVALYTRGALRLIKLFAPEALEAERETLIETFGDRARRALA